MLALTMIQSWVIVELILVLVHMRRQMNGQNPNYPEKCIKWARAAVSLILASFVLANLLYFNYLGNKHAGMPQIFKRFTINYHLLCRYAPALQAFSFLVVSITISVLFVQLHKLKPFLSDQAKVFERERFQMVLILVIFDISIISRAVFDYIYAYRLYLEGAGYTQTLILCLIFLPMILDFLPITMLLIFHTMNFKTLRGRAASTRTDSFLP